jgi:hypothetical protein
MRMLSHAVALCCAIAPLAAQQPSVFASRVVAFDDRNQAGGGVFQPGNALGRADGSVHSLGRGGSLTLGFDVRITDGPGADLIVSENPFRSLGAPWETFAEVCFVEVSSDGRNFARIPSRYTGPQVDPGPFAFLNAGFYGGLAGGAAVELAAPDPRDLVEAGGDAFDLADLIGDPLVQAGLVDLAAIAEVRLVDAVSGVDLDSAGVVIRDTGGGGSADIDGVTVLQHQGNQAPRGPRVELTIPADGDFALTISDPDGIADLDVASLGVALFGVEVDPATLFEIGVVTAVGADSFTLRLGGSLPASIPLRMSVAVQDRAGNRSGASRTRP